MTTNTPVETKSRQEQDTIYKMMSEEFGQINEPNIAYVDGPYWYIDEITIVAEYEEKFIIVDNFINPPKDHNVDYECPTVLDCDTTLDASFSMDKIKDSIRKFRLYR